MKRERGAALLMALMLLIVVSAAGATMHARSLRVATETILEKRALTARWAAEGGIALTRAALARDEGFDGGTSTVGDAEVRVTVEGDGDLRIVESVAFVRPSGDHGPRTRVRIRASLRLGDGLPAIESWNELD